MGDLLSRSRNKLIRRLTSQASPSPLKTSIAVPAEGLDRPQTASTSRQQHHKIEEQGSASRSTKSSDRLAGTVTNRSQAESGSSEAKPPPPPLIVQEPTPPPNTSAGPPPPNGASTQPSSHPASQRNVVVKVESPVSGRAAGSEPIATTRTREELSAPEHNVKHMARRKLWIKRPGASPTLVQANHDDVVDEVRDMVLRKYSNSLGRTFDSPDVTIRILPREPSQQAAERCLNPEESIWQVIDSYYPGGQQVDEALLVDVGVRRTPKPSPRIVNHMNGYFEDTRPVESDGDYFPPMPATHSPNPPALAAAGERRPSLSQAFHPHSMAILETGTLPPLPSPGLRNRNRPRYGRQHTSSPTIMSSVPKPNINSALHHPGAGPQPRQRSLAEHAPTPPPLPTPPLADPAVKSIPTKVSTPPLDRVGSPRPHKAAKTTRDRKASNANERPNIDGRRPSDKQPTYSFLEAAVPPINVLIVEDNPINLRLLEAFAKKLNVRWSTAMNGRDAVLKWREGGFHLVLMDIQLPIMSGLEATKEIRRLERVNGIGIFVRSEIEDRVATPKANGAEPDTDGSTEAAASTNDKLEGVFKSPVIIVALTASSLQSDRHEALAAGCNDFLTKPVSFLYLERKVMEWGCMQALIDFDGWRKWKDMANAADEEKAKKLANETQEAREKREKKEARRAAIMAKMGQSGG